MISSGDISIRLLRSADLDLMAKWLSDPKVYEFVHGKPKDLTWVKKKYGPRIVKKEKINSSIIEYKSTPVGYIQYFDIKPYEADYEMKNTKDIWAIDLWIGEPAYWEKGIGSKALKLVIDNIIKNKKAKKIIIDPHVDNPRAIHVYEKVGFKKVKILKAHEAYKDTKVDAWLMEIEK